MLGVAFSNQSLHFLRKTDARTAGRITEKIEALRNGSETAEKRLQNSPYFSKRVGDCRIVYLIDYEKQELEIVRIDKRENVY